MYRLFPLSNTPANHVESQYRPLQFSCRIFIRSSKAIRRDEVSQKVDDAKSPPPTTPPTHTPTPRQSSPAGLKKYIKKSIPQQFVQLKLIEVPIPFQSALEFFSSFKSSSGCGGGGGGGGRGAGGGGNNFFLSNPLPLEWHAQAIMICGKTACCQQIMSCYKKFID